MKKQSEKIPSSSRTQGFFEKVRFLLAGSLNTLVDFSLLNLFISLAHLPIVLANIGSTSAAMLVSLLLNKHLVFRDKNPLTRRQLVLFVGITLSSLWVVQSLIIWLLTKEFPTPLTTFVHELAGGGLSHVPTEVFLRNNIAKIIATVASLVWNYYFYKRVVFKGND